MEVVIFLGLLILIPLLLCLIDRRIEGCRSVFFKLLNVIVVTNFILFVAYFYGQEILTAFRVDMKSLTSMKGFFNTRILMYFLLLMLVILAACKFVFAILVFKSQKKTLSKTEKKVFIAAIVFDLVVIPNIFVNSAFFALFAVTTLLEIGLVYKKLVFSNLFINKREVLA